MPETKTPQAPATKKTNRTRPALSGRKLGSGPYGHPTVAVRVPTFLVDHVKRFAKALVHLNALKPIDDDAVRRYVENMTENVE